MGRPSDEDGLYEYALEVVFNEGKISTSLLQKRLSIGYNRAKRLIKLMDGTSFISPEGKVLTVLESAKEYQKIRKPRTLQQIAKVHGEHVDEKYLDALKLAKEKGYVSINLLMKVLKIGYPRAARIMDELGILGEIELYAKHRRSKYLK